MGRPGGQALRGVHDSGDLGPPRREIRALVVARGPQRARIEVRDASGGGVSRVGAEPETAQRLDRTNRVAALSFVIGGSLFSLGALFAQVGIGSTTTVDVVYLVGGVFFSLGGYMSVVQAVNAPTVLDERGPLASGGWRWFGFLPRQLGWLSAAVLFVGTLLFGVSLVAAFATGLTARQSNGWIWFPDILGCLCLLASGHLAVLEVCHGRVGVRVHELGWWVVAVNQFGSALFFLAGLAAYTRPATSEVINLRMVNWGTFLGAVCFVAGGVLQAFERPSRDSP
ncbi:MAG: hypothetical protein J2P22_15470 [Nocardioides sp.]|nr:hypothetical protein [Nocardioides sp.]